MNVQVSLPSRPNLCVPCGWRNCSVAEQAFVSVERALEGF